LPRMGTTDRSGRRAFPGRPTGAAGGHHGPFGQVFERQARTKTGSLLAPGCPLGHGILLGGDPNRVAVEQHLAHIGPRPHRSEGEPLGQLGGQILQAVHRQVGTALEQGHLQLLGEQPLGQRFRSRQGRGLKGVARGTDHLQLEAFAGKGRLQMGLNLTGLGQGQGAAPGGDEDGSIQGHDDQAAGERKANGPKRRAPSNSTAASRMRTSHRATSSRR